MLNTSNLAALKQGQSIPFTHGLSIRLIRSADLPFIIEMLNDSRVNQYLFFAPAADALYQGFFNPIIENTANAIKAEQWPESPTFVIHDGQGRYMGITAITSVMFLTGNYEVGYQLPFHALGQGIATRACQLMLEIGFSQLGAHKISADCYASNIGSYTVMEKCGMSLEGRQRAYYKMDKGFDDKVYYGITKAEFERIN